MSFAEQYGELMLVLAMQQWGCVAPRRMKDALTALPDCSRYSECKMKMFSDLCFEFLFRYLSDIEQQDAHEALTDILLVDCLCDH